VITSCQGAGLRSIDFRDKDHEKVFEALEKMKNANQIKNATFPVLNQLRKELGESRKVLLTKLETHGKKFAPCDLGPMISSVMLKARLRRMSDATSKGIGLKTDPSAPAPVGAAGTAARADPVRHPGDASKPGAPTGPPNMRPGMAMPGRGAAPPGMAPGNPHMPMGGNMPPGMVNAPPGYPPIRR